MPLDVTVECPEARVVCDEAKDGMRVRRDNERVAPAEKWFQAFSEVPNEDDLPLTASGFGYR